MSKKKIDWSLLDVKKWWRTHRLEIVPSGENTWVGECPWKIAHAQPASRATLVTTGSAHEITCTDVNCSNRSFEDLKKMWEDGGYHCTKNDDNAADADTLFPLGFTPKGDYYYQSGRTGHLRALNPNQHTELNMYSLIPNAAFWKKFSDTADGISWKMCARKMMALCQEKGYYIKSETRGSGIFIDRRRIVVNLGNNLLVNNPGDDNFKMVSMADFEGDFFYASSNTITLPEPASNEELKKVLRLLEKLPFESAGGATVLIGAIVCGWLAGALKWRPHFWLNSKPGGGKSEILNRVVKMLQPVGGLYFKGDTTAAGIRDATKNSSGLFVVDELEKMSGSSNAFSNASTVRRADQIIEMMRSASESSTASIAKGDPSGEGMQSQIRCCALLASVYHGIETPQDYRRFCFVKLTDPRTRTKEENAEYANHVQKELESTFTREYCMSLYAWAIYNSRYILETIDYFVSVMLSASNDRGECDQWGTVLGAAWCLTQYGKRPTPDEIINMFNICHPNKDTDRIEHADLDHGAVSMAALMQTRPAGEHTNIGDQVDSVVYSKSIGASAPEGVEAWLERYGIKIEYRNKSAYMLVHPNHIELRKVMAVSGYASYRQALLSYPGATITNRETSYSRVKVKSVIVIPMEPGEARIPEKRQVSVQDVAEYGRRE